MISIKDYAESKKVSYETVRRQVVRYEKELKDHIQVVNRTKYLDDEAVSFLDQHRDKTPVVVYDGSSESEKDEEIKQLRAEKEELQAKILKLSEEILARTDQILLTERKNSTLQEQIGQKNTEIGDLKLQILALELKEEKEEKESREPDLNSGLHYEERVTEKLSPDMLQSQPYPESKQKKKSFWNFFRR